MSRDYRILKKAQLAAELFGEAHPSHSSEEQEAPERPRPTTVEEAKPAATPPPTIEPKAPPPPVPPLTIEQRAARMRAVEQPTPEPQQLEQAPIQAPTPEPEATARTVSPEWPQVLGELLDDSSLGACRTLAVSPIGSLESAAETAAALGQWMAERSAGRCLVVEANLKHPRLARLFHTQRKGLSEAWGQTDPMETFVCDTHIDNLKILPAGRGLPRRDLQSFHTSLAQIVDGLRAHFDSIIVELPGPHPPEIAAIDWTSAADATLLVVHPKRASRMETGNAVRRLRNKGIKPAGAVLAQTFSVGESIRMERIGRTIRSARKPEHIATRAAS